MQSVDKNVSFTSKTYYTKKNEYDDGCHNRRLQTNLCTETNSHRNTDKPRYTYTCTKHMKRFESLMFLFCLVFAMFCARLCICALWSPAGKGLTSWLSFVLSSVSLSLSHWYPGSGVVLDCIVS